ncbi:MAG: hypothetical protein HQM08_27940 [Candidatus Riflebacteria bacterium]|nr:hypothetical protein [Candidatus Riflebacteria bacterium]
MWENRGKFAAGYVLNFLLILFPIILFLAFFFHSAVVKTRFLFKRVDQNELLEELSESSADEAFIRFSRNLSVQNSLEFRWVLSHMDSPFKIELPFAQTLIENSEKKSGNFSLKATARIKSFRNCDWEKIPYSIDNREGEGILEFSTIVEFKNTEGQIFQREVIRDHSYKVCAFASPEKDDSSGYNRSFVLHYAFLSRTLPEELNNTQDYTGFSKLEITNPSGVSGKLYFGGSTNFDENFFIIDSASVSKELFFAPTGRKITSFAVGKNGFRPFFGVSLFTRRFPSQEELYESDLFDVSRKKLALNCAVQVGGRVVIGENGQTITHEGAGLIFADSIAIEGAIKKCNPDDILILFARNGAVEIETENQIEAALIAVNDGLSGEIVSRGTFSVLGSLIADKINIKNRSIGASHLVYDPGFNPGEAKFCVSVLPWTLFQFVRDSQVN